MGASGANAILNVLDQGHVVDTVQLGEGVLTIGRDRCDLVLDDPETSTKHCKIEFVSGAHQIFDLNSTNGIFLNGQKIAKARLNPGDKIRVGKTEFVFDYASASPKQGSSAQVFELSRVPPPAEPEAAALDLLLTRERERFFSALRLVVDATFADGTSEQLSIVRELVIGRLSPEGRFSKDEELSRRHARLFLDENAEPWVEDLGSTNGVLVNNVRIGKPLRLEGDDVVKLGRCRLKVRVRPGLEYGG
jgi:pSer/pThr/pTyr-binding forkhead associated (FHA) protein